MVQAGSLTPDQWAELQLKGEVTKVTVTTTPVVEFKVYDDAGRPVLGLEKFTKFATSTDKLTSYPNFAFMLSKLVPGASGSNSKWVSYLISSTPTVSSPTAAPTRPTTDNTGTLVGNGDGSYKYTFYRDVVGMKAWVDGLPATTWTTTNVKADLGDLTWAPTLQHRVVIQLGGAARGTGTNTADGVTVTPSVAATNPANIVYDFVPSTGAKIAKADLQRDVVNISSCNVCHDKLAFHGGNRVDTAYCTTCHTSQRGYGQTKVTSTANAFPALTETVTTNAVTGIKSYAYAPSTYVGDGEVMGNFTTLIHKIHNGAELVKQNYNYANVAFNLKGFSMLDAGQRMCTVCHDTAVASKAGNAYSVPTRESCGACHDGINFATGTGTTIGGATTGHEGRAQSDDSKCVLCHGADQSKIDHQTQNITPHNPTIASGLASFTYEIKSASVNATTNDVTIEFRVLKAVSPSTTASAVTFLAPAAGMANPLTGFTGSPSFLLAYAMPQDGIAAADLVDYNNAGIKQGQPISVSIANLLDTAKAADGSMVASTTNPGYYTVTIKGTGAKKFPVGAKLRAVALQGYFTQADSTFASVARHAKSVIASIDTARRKVVDSAKCANCHEWFEGHGGNRVYEIQVCVMCHNPSLATSGRGISDAAIQAYAFTPADNKILADWGFDKTKPNAALAFPVTSNNFKDMIHGIHAGRERVETFMDARDRTGGAVPPSAGTINLLDFRRLDFPGTLNNCGMCHVVSASSTTQTFNTVPSKAFVSTFESIDAAYAAAIAGGTATPAIAKTALNTVNATDSVKSPFTAACASCHNSPSAKAHMQSSGGVVSGARSAAIGAVEACVTCHGPGAEIDAAVVHK